MADSASSEAGRSQAAQARAPSAVSVALDTGECPLTSRETDVLREAAAGIPTDQIGTRLSLSPATVRNYLSSAISKVGAQNRIDAIRVARQNGWL